MLRRRPLTAVFVAAVMPLLTMVATACTDDANEPAMVEPDEVYVAVIRWELSRTDDPTDTSVADSQPDSGLPIVYVAAADGSQIPAKVQAKVAAATVNDAHVRFADSADDVVNADDETEPVIDDAVLLSVERIEPDPSKRLTTEVVVYRSLNDEETWQLTIDAAGDGATITASSLQPT